MNLYVVQYNKLYTIPNVLNRFVQLRFHINIIRECVGADSDSDSDSDSDRGLFNIKLQTKVLHQVYIAKQYEHFEQIWTWHNQKYLLGDL